MIKQETLQSFASVVVCLTPRALPEQLYNSKSIMLEAERDALIYYAQRQEVFYDFWLPNVIMS